MEINEYGLFVVFDNPLPPHQTYDLPLKEIPHFTLQEVGAAGYYLHGEIVMHALTLPDYRFAITWFATPAPISKILNNIGGWDLWQIAEIFLNREQTGGF